MTAVELKETRQKLGLSLKDAARIFDTPERTWRAWETETGQNARRVPGFVKAGLEHYGKLREAMQFIKECRDKVLYPLAHEPTELGKIAEGLGGCTVHLLKTRSGTEG